MRFMERNSVIILVTFDADEKNELCCQAMSMPVSNM